MSKIPGWMRAPSPVGWVLMLAGVALFVFGLWWFATEPGRARDRAAAAAAGQVVAEGRAKGAQDAVVILDGHVQGADVIDLRVKESEDAIRKADPGDRDALTVRELCKSASAQRRPECLQRPDP